MGDLELGLSNALDGVVGSLGSNLAEVPGILDNTGRSLGGVELDLDGLIPPAGPFQQCIAAALGGDSSLYAFPQDILEELTNNHPYNLDYPWTPAAIVYPRNTIDVSNVVVCASEYGIAVQAKSGGHSYKNFGEREDDPLLLVYRLIEFLRIWWPRWLFSNGPTAHG